jgi:hypothetical protein
VQNLNLSSIFSGNKQAFYYPIRGSEISLGISIANFSHEIIIEIEVKAT